MSLEWCKKSDAGLPRPDLVIYMTLSDDKLAQRNGFGDEVYESLDFQARVKLNYTKLIDDSWKVISADDTIDSLNDQILKLIQDEIHAVDDKPLRTLWTE